MAQGLGSTHCRCLSTTSQACWLDPSTTSRKVPLCFSVALSGALSGSDAGVLCVCVSLCLAVSLCVSVALCLCLSESGGWSEAHAQVLTAAAEYLQRTEVVEALQGELAALRASGARVCFASSFSVSLRVSVCQVSCGWSRSAFTRRGVGEVRYQIVTSQIYILI